MKLEELLKFHGKIPTGLGDIWILRGLLGHFDPGMSVKVKEMILLVFHTYEEYKSLLVFYCMHCHDPMNCFPAIDFCSSFSCVTL